MVRPLPGLPGPGLTVTFTDGAVAAAAPEAATRTDARAEPTVHVLGVRHHGPGSARAVAEALDQVAPDAVVIEGPPELDAVAPLVASPAMVPPVAALVYRPDRPSAAAFYPFAAFSPEWVALRWALAHEVPVRFADLAATHVLADEAEDDEGSDLRRGPGRDPLGALAEAAGYDDAERWWDDVVEHGRQGPGVDRLEAFAAITEAMAELRRAEGDAGIVDTGNERREAAMRRVLRAVVKDGATRVVVVCGAWHAPALQLATWPSVAADNKLLKGLPKAKVAATWVPWTSSRLSRSSGYGAGVTAPGWYGHLLATEGDPLAPWLVRTARLLRDEQLDTSSASVIEAVRLAEALAGLRGRPLAGLSETLDATRSVMLGGRDDALALVSRRLLVGDDIGAVPLETPMVPLARDLADQQRRLRLTPKPLPTTVDLDLRTTSHLARSRLLWRLRLLRIFWGEPIDAGRTLGTFRERWLLEWAPELTVRVIEAAGAGTTVEAAASATARARAESAPHLGELTQLVGDCLLADLPEAVAATMAAVAERTALTHDTAALMDAVEPLARVQRYGDVRRADTELVGRVLSGIVTRVAIGLPAAAASLDDDAAVALAHRVGAVNRGVALLDDDGLRGAWLGSLAALADRQGLHGLLGGRANRLLLDGGRRSAPEVRVQLSLALSRGAEHTRAAAWLEGFLEGDALLLVHDHDLLAVIDEWLAGVPTTAFDDLLPLVRRAFARYAKPERRLIGQHVRALEPGALRSVAAVDAASAGGRDEERAARVLPRLLELIGREG